MTTKISDCCHICKRRQKPSTCQWQGKTTLNNLICTWLKPCSIKTLGLSCWLHPFKDHLMSKRRQKVSQVNLSRTRRGKVLPFRLCKELPQQTTSRVEKEQMEPCRYWRKSGAKTNLKTHRTRISIEVFSRSAWTIDSMFSRIGVRVIRGRSK